LLHSDATVHGLFERQVLGSPDAVALECEVARWTYAELDRWANRIARRLRALGVGPEAIVAIHLERGPSLVAAMLGVLKAGGAYFPLDPRDPEPRLRVLLQDARPAAVIAEESARGRVADQANLLFLNGDGGEGGEPPPPVPDPPGLACIMYTSGSTGVPRGVEVMHRGIVRLLHDVDYVQLDAREVLLHAAPPTFDASTFEVWGALLNGARLVILPSGRPSIEEIAEAVERRGVTTLWLTAPLFRQMVDSGIARLRGLRQLLTGGDVMSAPHVRAALAAHPSLKVINGYGPTECTTFACAHRCESPLSIADSVPIGQPIGGRTVYLLDETRAPVGDGEVGEIYIGGEGVARGYLNRPGETAKAFLPDPFAARPGARMYRTGDRARRGGDGALLFLGRADRQVKLRGFRVELDEIEAVLRLHPAVRDAAVTVTANAAADKDLIAYVVARPDHRAMMTAPGKARNALRRRREVYDQVIYDGIDGPVEDATLNIAGWRSSYTGAALSPDEMREQVEQTVTRIRRRNPQRVLEIGCGTGMLLFRIAPDCRRYVAMDFSEAALAWLEQALDGRSFPCRIDLLHRDADDPPTTERFDAVVLNSVVQHFPSVDYLCKVLHRSLALVDEGGFVFIGDVRSLSLLRLFHLSVELSRTADDTPVHELARLVESAMREERELILDPAFFTGAGFDRVGGARVQLKRGHHRNELTGFRYDVELEIGAAPLEAADPERLEVRDAGGLEQLASALRGGRQGAVRVSGVPNRRLRMERAAAYLLDAEPRPFRVGELRERLAAQDHFAVDPEELWRLGESHGYDVHVDWTEGSPEGAFDVTFVRPPARAPLRPARFDECWRRHAHDPLGPFARNELTAELRSWMKERYPAYMVPSFFVVIDRLPLTSSGKIDTTKLPPPEPLRRRRERNPAPPEGKRAVLSRAWREALGVDAVRADENFFDLGGDSLKAIVLVERIRQVLGVTLSPVSVFEHPTIERMIRQLDGAPDRRPEAAPRAPAVIAAPACGSEIAIIGMSIRVPGAGDLDSFWRNLCDGVESFTRLSPEELREGGVEAALLADPDYVPMARLLDDGEAFDAAFFGYTPREARYIDPQQRVLLECAWDALDHAGYDLQRGSKNVGTFVGSSLNTYLLHSGIIPQLEKEFVLTLSSSDKDFLATRINFKLDLQGPALTIQTACSTSLVAVHVACQSLRAGECDAALAGGVCVKVPGKRGYLWRRGGLLAADGRVRAFDAQATGTAFGSGAGLVVLKRLADAVRDHDSIYAVIKGSAVNNDGAGKASYAAPSIGRQADVVVQALANAGVAPDTVSYIEAHGTGTPLGDPIEIEALTRAFRSGTSRTRYCAIGALKSNVGHLEAAAGVAGLIKTVLSLHHGTLPRSVNYETPNPQIDFEQSPFFVNTATTPWIGSAPRRAGVNALGVGGTNVHVILEEAPGVPPRPSPTRLPQVLTLSARTEAALDALAARLASHLERHDADLADVAYTLQTGRKPFRLREALVCEDGTDAIARLRLPRPRAHATPRELVFVCPPHGARSHELEALLYDLQPVFRARVDGCRIWLRDQHGIAIDAVTGADSEFASFITQYALLELLGSWGIRPARLVGIGVGELVAACAAGIITVERSLAVLAGDFTGGAPPRAPGLPVFASATGSWLGEGDLPDDAGWAERVRSRHHDTAALRSLSGRDVLWLELGTGAEPAPLPTRPAGYFTTTPTARHPMSGLLTALGQLWSEGVDVDWSALHVDGGCRRIALPTYPFQRQRYFWGDP
jgi:amino acid adenylation domain-containing protein